MVSINYSAREVCCKIVYYGPGLSGKTTNLQYVHAKVPGDTRGKLISLATEADRTLYFDFLPINIGTINGFAAKFQLYTVPGQVYYNATRKLVLRGVDGVVFVADSQPDKMDENIESLLNLEENLREYGYDLEDMPVVLQYNKCDLPGVLSPGELNARLNTRSWPWFEASATIGNGVFDTLKLIIKLVLEKAKRSGAGSRRTEAASTASPAPAPTRSAAPPAPSSSVRVGVPSMAATPVAAAAASSGASSAPAAARLAPSRETTTRATQPKVPVPVPKTAPTSSSEAPVAAGPAKPTASEATEARPFPGDHSAGIPARLISPSSFTPTPKEDASAASSAGAGGTSAERMRAPEDLSRPSMAPPLRRRGSKKRGLFKRLFGIK